MSEIANSFDNLPINDLLVAIAMIVVLLGFWLAHHITRRRT